MLSSPAKPQSPDCVWFPGYFRVLEEPPDLHHTSNSVHMGDHESHSTRISDERRPNREVEGYTGDDGSGQLRATKELPCCVAHPYFPCPAYTTLHRVSLSCGDPPSSQAGWHARIPSVEMKSEEERRELQNADTRGLPPWLPASRASATRGKRPASGEAYAFTQRSQWTSSVHTRLESFLPKT